MKTCLHTVSYAGLWGQARLSVEETIDKAAALGFDGIMLMAKRPHASVLDLTRQKLGDLKARMDDHGLVCACIAGYTNFTADAEHGDIPDVELHIHHTEHLGRIAAALGCKIIRVFTGYENPAMGFHDAWRRCADALRQAADRVADLNITLAVQNHHDIGAHYLALRELLEEVDRPNCGAAFDAWTPTLHGDDVVAAARAMATLTVHTTAADYVCLPRYHYQPALVNYGVQDAYVRAVPMGEGIVDYRGFLGVLLAAGYSGYVGYEMCSPLRGGGGIENLDRCARRFLDTVAVTGSGA